MKKIIFFSIMCLLLSGCASTSAPSGESLLGNNVEHDIREGGKKFVESNDKIDLTYYKEIDFKFEEKEKCFYFLKDNQIIGAMQFNGKDYENFFSNTIESIPPEISKEREVPLEFKKKFDMAKELVKAYIEQSSVIMEEDKPAVKKAIKKIKLMAGEFSSNHSEFGMVTFKNSIYINMNTDVIEFLDEYVFVHELLHVANRVTSKGSIYKNSALNHGGLSEGITDLLALTIVAGAKIDCWESVTHCRYANYYETVYTLMSNDNFNVLEAYFYPDNYQKLIDMTSDEFVKAIFYSVFMLDENGYSNVNDLCKKMYLALQI